MGNLNRAAADFGARDMILSLRSLAKSLADVPGRKTLVLLTSGFPLSDDQRLEVTATIDACNKANVAIYPIDVRGLVAGGPTGSLRAPKQGRIVELVARDVDIRISTLGSAFLQPAAYQPGAMGFFQHPGGGGGGAPSGGGGGHPTGGSGGGTGSGSGSGSGGKSGGTGTGTGAGAGGGKGGGGTVNNPSNSEHIQS